MPVVLADAGLPLSARRRIALVGQGAHRTGKARARAVLRHQRRYGSPTSWANTTGCERIASPRCTRRLAQVHKHAGPVNADVSLSRHSASTRPPCSLGRRASKYLAARRRPRGDGAPTEAEVPQASKLGTYRGRRVALDAANAIAVVQAMTKSCFLHMPGAFAGAMSRRCRRSCSHRSAASATGQQRTRHHDGGWEQRNHVDGGE